MTLKIGAFTISRSQDLDRATTSVRIFENSGNQGPGLFRALKKIMKKLNHFLASLFLKKKKKKIILASPFHISTIINPSRQITRIGRLLLF